MLLCFEGTSYKIKGDSIKVYMYIIYTNQRYSLLLMDFLSVHL